MEIPKRKQPIYTAVQKDNALAQITGPDKKPLNTIARELKIPRGTLRAWRDNAGARPKRGPPCTLTPDQTAELVEYIQQLRTGCFCVTPARVRSMAAQILYADRPELQEADKKAHVRRFGKAWMKQLMRSHGLSFKLVWVGLYSKHQLNW